MSRTVRNQVDRRYPRKHSARPGEPDTGAWDGWNVTDAPEPDSKQKFNNIRNQRKQAQYHDSTESV